MTDWTDITDASLEPGKPIRSVDGVALRDNPIAIAEGAAGAPKVQTAGMADYAVTALKLATGTAERDWVLARTAAAAVGGVGTYAFMGMSFSGTFVTPGGTLAGSSLYYAGVHSQTPWDNVSDIGIRGAGSSVAASGTWMCMGNAVGDIGPNVAPATLWLRVA